MRENDPPFIVKLVAALAITLGAAALIRIIVSFACLNVNVDFAVLGIPLGRGLLLQQPSARKWAIGLSAVFFLALAGQFAWVIYTGQRGPWIAITEGAVMLLVSAIAFFGLLSAKAIGWFAPEPAASPAAADWTITFFVVGALFAMLTAMDDYAWNSSAQKLFPVSTKFEFRNTRTGTGVSDVSGTSPAISISSESRDVFAPRISLSRQGPPHQATGLIARGLSNRSFEVTFSADGFEPVKYIIDRTTPAEVTLEFQPKSPPPGR